MKEMLSLKVLCTDAQKGMGYIYEEPGQKDQRKKSAA